MSVTVIGCVQVDLLLSPVHGLPDAFIPGLSCLPGTAASPFPTRGRSNRGLHVANSETFDFIIVGAGFLFWKLVKSLARIQMPENPTRRPPA